MDAEHHDAEMSPADWAEQAAKVHAALRQLPPLPAVQTSSLDRANGPAKRTAPAQRRGGRRRGDHPPGIRGA